jgi:CheY-like chemotaxis protein
MDKFKNVIICIDDDPFILQMLQFQLKKHFDNEDVIIEFFTEYTELLTFTDEIINQSVELVLYIVDFQMPGINGAELIRKIKTKSPSSKFIMLSGQADNVNLNQLQTEKSLEAFIMKPWEEEELINVIATLIV